MTLREFFLFLISLAMSVGGQLLLKTGALKLGKVSAGNAVGHVFSIFTTPELLLGLTFYALSAVLYILLLTRVPLSVIGPAVSLSYIFSVLMGYFLFREPIPIARIAGLGFIVCGVLLVLWKK